ncbi:NAD/NADP octopine/nopaline dehydrogenase family protein [uncultured Enorma sp.]|uniref:NAD/NADP-dependent octopine/nopaline dehydrogenase family protein n=1 Tax=uncultured Enorma sp. TaxID=1714346 RepID=UPI00280654BA|nr:NAD/NADP octopine/nopaline dehydrogenase family protein [uncultured Enorma sp.]
MDITVFGAGNMGLALASVLSKDHSVVLFTNKESNATERVSLDYEGTLLESDQFEVTCDLQRACASDLILCTYPAFLRNNFIESIRTLLSKGQILGFVPGYGGIEYLCKPLIEDGVTVFGLQRVPYVARSDWKTRRASVLSAKSTLYAAALPRANTDAVCALVSSLLSIPTEPLTNYLAVTLVPSNPLLHTSGVYSIFKTYEPGQRYEKQMMFYEEWNDDTSRFLLQFDDELQEICRSLTPLDMSGVVPLSTYYESPSAEAMTRKLKSIEAFKVVKAPLVQTEAGCFVPNWNDRMFVEDFPFGVAIIKDISVLCGISTPCVDTLLKFYVEKTGRRFFDESDSPTCDKSTCLIPRNCGINSKSELITFYQN